jgi:hypothetical protein
MELKLENPRVRSAGKSTTRLGALSVIEIVEETRFGSLIDDRTGLYANT